MVEVREAAMVKSAAVPSTMPTSTVPAATASMETVKASAMEATTMEPTAMGAAAVEAATMTTAAAMTAADLYDPVGSSLSDRRCTRRDQRDRLRALRRGGEQEHRSRRERQAADKSRHRNPSANFIHRSTLPFFAFLGRTTASAQTIVIARLPHLRCCICPEG
jgi:hypothetical protein